jgi:DNA repair exonuclease SbcCD ATPase subunit
MFEGPTMHDLLKEIEDLEQALDNEKYEHEVEIEKLEDDISDRDEKIKELEAENERLIVKINSLIAYQEQLKDIKGGGNV